MSRYTTLRASRLGPYPGTHWTVLEYLGVFAGSHAYYYCRCACGCERPVDWTRLVRGRTKSCGRAACPYKQVGRSPSIVLTVGTKTQTLVMWAKETGIRYDTLYTRLKNNIAPSEVVDPHYRGTCYITAFDKTMTVSAWAREIGMKPITLFKRLQRGMPPEVALTKPVDRHTHNAKG